MNDRLSRVQQPDPLSRRVTEIAIAGRFFGEIESRWGKDAARKVLRSVVQAEAITSAKNTVIKPESRGLAGLYEVWMVLGGDKRLDIVLDELSETVLRFHITACSYAEEYKKRGLDELGIEFSCRRDKPFAEALLPGVRFKQSKTIMEGSECCEFEYRL